MIRLKIDLKDFTVTDPGDRFNGLYFLSAKYEDGHLLAFYSHSPCSHVRDQEQGWVLIDPKTKQIIDEVQTRSMGVCTCEGREKKKKWREEHGKMKYFVDKFGDRPWKITECD